MLYLLEIQSLKHIIQLSLNNSYFPSISSLLVLRAGTMLAFTCKWSRILLIILLIPIATRVTYSTKVDDSININPSIKCGECPCLNPCNQQLPPPLPPPPPPPYCSPPPPPPPPPPAQYCSPTPPAPALVPPPPRFIYVTGNLHPTNDPFNLQIYSRVAHTAACTFLLLLGCSALHLLLSF